MANDIMTLNQGKQILADNQLTVSYELPTYQLDNYELVSDTIEAINARMQTLVFNSDSKKDAIEVRSELIAIEKMIDDKRKDIKRELEKPAKAYDAQMKALANKIKPALANARQTVAAIEQKERELRETIVREFIDDLLENSPIDYIECQPHWTNAGAFTTKLKLTTKVQCEIRDAIQYMVQEKERLEKEIQIIKETATQNDLTVDAYIDMYKFGNELTDVLASINKAVNKRIEQQQETEKAAVVQEAPTKEVAPTQQPEQPYPPASFLDVLASTPYTYTKTFDITATPKKLQKLRFFMDAEDIEYTENMITTNDLPF